MRRSAGWTEIRPSSEEGPAVSNPRLFVGRQAFSLVLSIKRLWVEGGVTSYVAVHPSLQPNLNVHTIVT